MSAEQPVLELTRRDVGATMDASCSDHGLGLAISYAAPPPRGTPMQQLIERAVILHPPAWSLRLGDLDLVFGEGDRLQGVSLYRNFAALPDEPVRPVPPAPPVWLRFPGADAANGVVSVRAAVSVRVDRCSRRLRVTVGEERPAVLHSLADGLAVGVDEAGAVALLQVDRFEWEAPGPGRRS